VRERVRLAAVVALSAMAMVLLVAVPAGAILGADLTIASSASPNPVEAGERLTYTITVNNEGTEDSTNVTVTDVLASQLELEDAVPTVGICEGDTVVVCTLGTMTPGQSETIVLTVRPSSTGSVVNTAVVEGENEADTTDNASTTTVEVVEPSGGGAGGDCTITGTSGRDVLRGTSGTDVICGLGGKDRLLGLKGSDTLRGGAGGDILRGGPGNDRLIGQAGKDRLNGGRGRDRCRAQGGERARGCE
jgi:uncharacterized repeat protein (TIGR01451 family)